MDRLPKTVLEEEEYVETLEKIIERDFFPDLQTLKCHAAVSIIMKSNDVIS
jgi:hypothetical protein